jgi:PadR family transcriptional regulator, regulatory protein PadR
VFSDYESHALAPAISCCVGVSYSTHRSRYFFLDIHEIAVYILECNSDSALPMNGGSMTETNLGQFEELVLLAVFVLCENAYGANIRKTVATAKQDEVSIGAVYATLDRLERKGYITSWQGEATPKRGNRPKRYFRIQGSGERALKRAEGMRNRLMQLAIA